MAKRTLSDTGNVEFLRDNKKYQIFETDKKSGYQLKEIFKIITDKHDQICNGIPSQIENSAVFLLNVKDDCIFANIACYSMGVWTETGCPREYIIVNGDTVRLKSEESDYFDYCILL
jgi:hypothetical protein